MADNTPIQTDIQPGQQTSIPASNYDVNKDLGRVIDRTNVVDAPTAPNLLFGDGTPYTQGGGSKVNSVYAAYLGAMKNTPTNFLTTPQYTNKSVAEPYLTDNYGGFNPEDRNVANWYGENQGWFKQMGNRIGKLALTTVGSFANSLMDIPNMITAAHEGNIDKAWNNPTNTWATDLQNWAENKLPNYETNWERQHPFLNLIPFYGNAGNGWGNVLQQVGFTVGAIGGSLVEDAAVGALTGGAGDVPLAALQINKAIYKFGKMINIGEDTLEGVKGAIKSADDIVQGLKGVDRFNYAVRKGLWGANMITSGTAEAAFEGLDGFTQLNKDLTQEYFNQNGSMPDYDAQQKIYKTARDAGNARFLMNVGLLAVTNSIQWGSLLKPFNVAKDAIEAEAKTGIKVALQNGSRDVFEAVQPTSKLAKIGRAISNNKVVELVKDSGSEGFEEGAQYFIQTGVDDYYKRKYHDPSINQTNNFLKSFGTGLSSTLGSQEGWENIVYGVLGGAMYAGGEHVYRHNIQGIHEPSHEKTIQDVLTGLNTNTLTGIFENKYGEQVAADAIQDDMVKAAQANNPFLYKNYQHEQMVNFVLSGIRQNKFDTRMDQIDELTKMNQQDFQNTFGIPQTTENQKNVQDYVASMKNMAAYIKDVHDRVSRTFINPFQYQGTGKYKNAEEQEKQNTINEKSIAFEDAKDQLTYSMSIAKDSSNRIAQMKAEISASPVNADEVVKLSTDKGLRETRAEYARNAQAAQFEVNLTPSAASRKALDTWRDRISLIDEALNEKDPENAHKAYNNLLTSVFDQYQEVNNTITGDSGKTFDPSLKKEIMDKAQDIAFLGKRSEIAVNNYASLTTPGGFKNLFDKVMEERKRVASNPVTLAPENVAPQNAQVASVAQQVSTQNGTGTAGLATSQQQNTNPTNPQGSLEESTSELSPEDQKAYATAVVNVATGKDSAPSDQLDLAEEFQTIDELKDENPKVDLSQYTKVKSSDGKNYYIANTKLAEMQQRATGNTVATSVNLANTAAVVQNAGTPPTPTTPTPVGAGNGREGLRTQDFVSRVFVPQDLKGPFQTAIFTGLPAQLLDNMSVVISPLSNTLQEAYNKQQSSQFYTDVPGYPGVFVAKSPIDISIQHAGVEIGKLATPDRLLFKVDDKLLKLPDVTPQQYSQFTGNPAAQHAQDLARYNDMVALKNYLAVQYKNNNGAVTTVSTEDLKKLLNAPVVTYGQLDLIAPGGERPAYSELQHATIDVPTKDGKGTSVNLILSIPRVYSNDTASFVKTDHTNFIYNQEYYDNSENVDVSALESQVAGNMSALQHMGSRYVAAVSTPTKEVRYVALRPAELSTSAKSDLFDSIKERAKTSSEANFVETTEDQSDGFLLIGDQKVFYKLPNGDAKKFNDQFNTNLNNQLFVSDPNGKAFFELSVSPVGAIRMEVYDRLNRANTTLYIAPQTVDRVNNLGDMIDRLNKEVAKRTKTDATFAALGVKFDSSNFRQNIENDNRVTTNDIGGSLSSATSKNVFKDGTMNLSVNRPAVDAAYKKARGLEKTSPANQVAAPVLAQVGQSVEDRVAKYADLLKRVEALKTNNRATQAQVEALGKEILADKELSNLLPDDAKTSKRSDTSDAYALMDNMLSRGGGELTTTLEMLSNANSSYYAVKTPTTTVATNQSSDQIVQNVLDSQKQVEGLTPDKQHYIINGEQYRRVSNVIPSDFDGDSSKYENARIAGSTVDRMVREFFTPDFINDYSVPSKPEGMSQAAWDNIYNALKEIRKTINERGEKFLTNNIVLFDPISKIAGEVDILSQDKDGNFNIYDVKTAKDFSKYDSSFQGKMTKREQHTNQLSAYSNLFENEFGVKPKKLGIIPFQISYDADGNIQTAEKMKGISIKYDPNISSVVPLHGAVITTSSQAAIQEAITPAPIIATESKGIFGGIQQIQLDDQGMPVGMVSTQEVRDAKATTSLNQESNEDKTFTNANEALASVGIKYTINPSGVAVFSDIDSNEVMDNLQGMTPLELAKSMGLDVQPVKKSDPNAGFDFKLGNNGVDTLGRLVDINQVRSYVQTILPSDIKVEELDQVLKHLENQGISDPQTSVWGAFQNGVIYINTSAQDIGVGYHEAFHAVFNMMLSDEQRKPLIQYASEQQYLELKKEGSSIRDEIAKQREFGVWNNISYSQAVEKMAEEWMAEKFRGWKNNKENAGILQKFFDLIGRFFKWITRNKTELESLFSKIDNGYYKHTNIDSSFLGQTSDDDNGNPVVNLMLVPAKPGEMQVGKGTVTLKRNLDSKTSKQVVQNVAAYFDMYRNMDKYSQLSDNAVLDTILDDLKALYSVDNPLYAGRSESELNRIASSDLSYIYSNKESRDIIKEGAVDYVNTIKYIEQFRDEDQEAADQDTGQPSTGYDNTAENVGGFSSLPGLLRQYIGFTSYEKTDEFGNKQVTEGVPVVATVDSVSVYYGLMRSLANITDPVKFFQKMVLFGNGNEQSRHFVEKFVKDTGLNVQRLMEENTLEATDNPALVEMVKKGFNKFRIDYLFTEQDTKKQNARSYHANRKNVENTQFDKWSNQFANDYANYSEDAQKNIRNNIETVRSSYFDERKNIKWDAQKLADAVTRSQQALRGAGIQLAPEYIKYSILSGAAKKFDTLNETYKKQGVQLQFDDPENKFINKQDYDYVQIMKTADETILNADVLEQLSKTLAGGANPYHKDLKESEILDDNTNEVTKVQEEIDTAMIGRLLNIAKGNALFDETVGESSYTNAENKVVYAHQDGTFNVKFSYQLRDPNFRKQLREQGYREQIAAYRDAYDSTWLTQNFLLNSKEFEAIADNLLFNRVDGMRAVETNKLGKVITQEFRDQKEGITYGHYSPREFLVNFLNMYTSYAQTQRTSQGAITTTPNLIRILETSKTGDTVNLPVLSDLYKAGSVTQKTKDLLFSEFKKEYDRITRVNTEIGSLKENLVENYHTGSFGEDGVTVTKGYRGLKFTDNMTSLIPAATLNRMESQARAGNEISKADEQFIKNEVANSLNNIVDKTLDILTREGLVEKNKKGDYSNIFLHSDYFKGNDALNLGPRFKENIGHVLMNNYINTLAYNQLLHGDSALSLKNDGGIDAVKRAKGDNAAIVSMRTDLLAPELGITQPFTHSNVAIFKEPVAADGTKVADAQMYTTVNGLRYTLWGLSKLTPRVAKVLDALERGDNIHNMKDENGKSFDAIFDKEKGLLRWDEMTNSLKLVFKDGKSYFKMSVTVLQPNLTSYKDNEGNWKPIPGWETLHNLRTKMEDSQVHFAAPESASKMMTMDVARAKDFSDLVGHPYDNAYFGLQTVNPSNKLSITTPTQLMKLIDSEQTNETEVTVGGKDTTIGAVREVYQNNASQKVTNDFNAARNDIYKIQDFEKDLAESISKGEVTPRLARFQQRAVDNLENTGSDAQLIDFFSLDANGSPKYNLNMSATKNKFQQLYLAYFSKGVMSQKNPGYTAALFSGIDTKTIRRATRVEDGKVLQWEHIRRENWANNLNGVRRETILSSPDEVTEVGQFYLDELRHNVPEYDENGKETGNMYSEYMLPAHYKEFLDIPADEQIPDTIAKGFGVRIPSQDKHSFMSLKMVDFLPTNLGSTAMFAKDIVRLSGADFDIDKEYISRHDFYTVDNNGKPEFRPYGYAKTDAGKWYEYKKWMIENNKTLKSIAAEIDGTTPEQDSITGTELKLPPLKYKDATIEAALGQIGLPSTLEQFTEQSKKGELNNGVLNNQILDSYIALQTNSAMRDIANTPATLDALANIQKNEELVQRDKQGNVMGTVFGKKLTFPVDSVPGQYYGFKNNRVGKYNIGIDVQANLIYSILNKANTTIRENEKVQPFKFDGATFNTFGGQNEYNPATKQFDGARTNDVFSTLITSATDEAKEQLNALYNLTVDSLKTVNYMVGLKVPLKTAIYMANQPSIRSYLDIKAAKQNTLQTPAEEKLFRDDFREEAISRLNDDIKDYNSLSDDDLYATLQQSGNLELQCD